MQECMVRICPVVRRDGFQELNHDIICHLEFLGAHVFEDVKAECYLRSHLFQNGSQH